MLVPIAASLMLSATMIATPQGAAGSLDQDRTDVGKMQASVNKLKSSPGYRYGAHVTLVPAVPGTQRPSGTEDPSGDEVISIQWDGAFARTQPLHLTGPEFEAYRLGQRVVFTEEGGLWRLQENPPVLPDRSRNLSPVAAGNKEKEISDQAQPVRAWQLWTACTVPAPHELLQQVDTATATFQRSVDEGGIFSSDDLVFTTRLEGKAIPAVCLSVLGHANQMVCTLRIITNEEGALQRLELQGTRESLGKKGVNARKTGNAVKDLQHELTIAYSVQDIGDAIQLEIPQAVQLLFDH